MQRVRARAKPALHETQHLSHRRQFPAGKRLTPRYCRIPRNGRFLRDRRACPLSFYENSLKEAIRIAKGHDFATARQRALVLEGRATLSRQAKAMLLLAEALHDWGYLTDAERCCTEAIKLAERRDAPSLVTKKLALYLLGAIAGEAANHAVARHICRELLRIFPNDPAVMLYHIFHMSYDPEQHLRRQKAWARLWAKGVMPPAGSCQRPPALPLHGRPLRVGYVSADFDIHPVGFFVRGVLPAHDPRRVRVFAYNCGDSSNLIAQMIGQGTTVRHVASLDDAQLDALIREDGIDVLVDLSGLTRGTRLAVFAREPAPVLVTWLGYWATSGLPCMDAVLLDHWHAPEDTEQYFTEPIVRLPVTRFCYQPIAEDPPVRPKPPCMERGYVTFGSFNNTTKLTGPVLDVWARVLASVPHSRLLFKWKTFHDTALQERIRRSFKARSIDPARLEFRGWSPLRTMLAQFNDMDIMLDCFPFTGGMTTCNALWMGVPVVTLAGESVVSRQGHAILGQLGLEELSARNVEHYVNIAVGLAGNLPLLTLLHCTLRGRMRASPLLDVPGFTRHLEEAFFTLYNKRIQQA